MLQALKRKLLYHELNNNFELCSLNSMVGTGAKQQHSYANTSVIQLITQGGFFKRQTITVLESYPSQTLHTEIN